ncbi:cobyric acid synthase [Humibacillus xanthopallidus]|uniref:Cobyric acid synthase n=1 Tax=Humibacillus xanthopallidus TaxID=412689 RepID=A0A543I2V9_9MICO|nr:cobyric acid synthase [Humibacillus xanthopallidus]TQM64915.1 cobyric acid synthase CobQ [Humibacillus xanthopallidus]
MSAASGILVAGTSSDAGKSVIVAGLCRALARRGVRVAPFKAQNMSNNSMVCLDGGEIGRAQYLQAQRARVEPTTAMNPVLLKPGTDRRAFIVVRGEPAGTLEAGQYAAGRGHLRDAAFAAYRELAGDYDLVVCEGAGSPAEINLRAGDYVNLGLAREFDLPVVVVGDIDRGGILASLYGTWALLGDADRDTLKAFVINKFRGDVAVLEPGLEEITARTGVPFAGVIPWLLDVWLDSEDTLEVGHWRAGHVVDTAYEIHHGRASLVGADGSGRPDQLVPQAFLDGWRAGAVWGTMWHGAFESDDFRRAWLAQIAAAVGSEWTAAEGAPGFAARREGMLETLADALEEHVDIDSLLIHTRIGIGRRS